MHNIPDCKRHNDSHDGAVQEFETIHLFAAVTDVVLYFMFTFTCSSLVK
jgi:hypothetical protein